jgi:hypothetical protein
VEGPLLASLPRVQEGGGGFLSENHREIKLKVRLGFELSLPYFESAVDCFNSMVDCFESMVDCFDCSGPGPVCLAFSVSSRAFFGYVDDLSRPASH